MKELPLHKLVNRIDSPHYDDDEKGVSSIEEMELDMSIKEMIGAMKYNKFRVNWRMGKKDPEEKELRKIATYKAYQKELQRLILDGVDSDISVANGWKARGKEWRFR